MAQTVKIGIDTMLIKKTNHVNARKITLQITKNVLFDEKFVFMLRII
jgi:hypothetical protein